MDRLIAIKKISEKFSISENEIIKLLDENKTPRNSKSTPQKKDKKIGYQAIDQKVDKKIETSKKRYFFTEDDYNSLIKQMGKIIEEIKRVGGEIGDSVSDSKTFHDNFEYEEFGRQQKMWTSRLRSLEKFKENVEIIQIKPTPECISIGSKVTIEMKDGRILTKKIGSYITFSEDDLSYNSPLAKIMVGKKTGDEIHEKINNQYYSFTIKEVR